MSKRYDPNTIAFGAEIVHAPIQLEAQKVQAIHNSLFRNPEVSYQSFQVAQDGIHLSNLATAPGQVSVATFLPDRVALREEFRACTVEDFATRVVNVLSVGYQALGIQQALAQQFWTRSLINTSHITDSRQFVTQRMIGGGQESLQCFGRPLQTVGLRYAFPQVDGNTGNLSLRIEPWIQEPRALWIEVVGQYTAPTSADNLPQLGNLLYSLYRFLTGPTLAYVARFDTP